MVISAQPIKVNDKLDEKTQHVIKRLEKYGTMNGVDYTAFAKKLNEEKITLDALLESKDKKNMLFKAAAEHVLKDYKPEPEVRQTPSQPEPLPKMRIVVTDKETKKKVQTETGSKADYILARLNELADEMKVRGKPEYEAEYREHARQFTEAMAGKTPEQQEAIFKGLKAGEHYADRHKNKKDQKYHDISDALASMINFQGSGAPENMTEDKKELIRYQESVIGGGVKNKAVFQAQSEAYQPKIDALNAAIERNSKAGNEAGLSANMEGGNKVVNYSNHVKQVVTQEEYIKTLKDARVANSIIKFEEKELEQRVALRDAIEKKHGITKSTRDDLESKFRGEIQQDNTKDAWARDMAAKMVAEAKAKPEGQRNKMDKDVIEMDERARQYAEVSRKPHNEVTEAERAVLSRGNVTVEQMLKVRYDQLHDCKTPEETQQVLKYDMNGGIFATSTFGDQSIVNGNRAVKAASEKYSKAFDQWAIPEDQQSMFEGAAKKAEARKEYVAALKEAYPKVPDAIIKREEEQAVREERAARVAQAEKDIFTRGPVAITSADRKDLYVNGQNKAITFAGGEVKESSGFKGLNNVQKAARYQMLADANKELLNDRDPEIRKQAEQAVKDAERGRNGYLKGMSVNSQQFRDEVDALRTKATKEYTQAAGQPVGEQHWLSEQGRGARTVVRKEYEQAEKEAERAKRIAEQDAAERTAKEAREARERAAKEKKTPEPKETTKEAKEKVEKEADEKVKTRPEPKAKETVPPKETKEAVKRKEELVKPKEEAVKRREEPVKPKEEAVKRREEAFKRSDKPAGMPELGKAFTDILASLRASSMVQLNKPDPVVASKDKDKGQSSKDSSSQRFDVATVMDIPGAPGSTTSSKRAAEKLDERNNPNRNA